MDMGVRTSTREGLHVRTQHQKDHEATGVDLAQSTSVLRSSRHGRTLLKAIAPFVILVGLFLGPPAALAAGDAELQIGNTVYSGTEAHYVDPGDEIAQNEAGDRLLADGTLSDANGIILADDGDDAKKAIRGAQKAAQAGDAATATEVTCTVANNDDRFSPIVRWGVSGAVNKHHQSLHGFKGIDGIGTAIIEVPKLAAGGITSMPGWIGNSLWGATAKFTTFAIDSCPMKTMGPSIDETTSKIGHAALDSGVVAVIVVLSLILVAWQFVKAARGGAVKPLLMKLLVPAILGALLVTMVNGASKSTTPEEMNKPNGPSYHAGFMSPGWIVTKTTSTLNGVVDGSMKGLNTLGSSDVVDEKLMRPAGKSDGDQIPMSCGPTMKQRAKDYGTITSPASKSLSGLWEKAALPYYVDYQYGGADNAYGWKTYCRTLDFQSGTMNDAESKGGPMKDVVKMLKEKGVLDEKAGTEDVEWQFDAYRRKGVSPDSKPDGGEPTKMSLKDAGPGPKFGWSGNTEEATQAAQDASMIGWLVCEPIDETHWRVADGAKNLRGVDKDVFDSWKWKYTPGGVVGKLAYDQVKKSKAKKDPEAESDALSPAACETWWSSNTPPRSMLIDGGTGDQVVTGNGELDEALAAIHSPASPDPVAGYALAGSGLIALVVFGGLSLVLLVSKIGVAVFGLFLIAAFLIGMWTGAEDKTVKFLKKFGGLLIVTVVAQAIFVLVASLSAVMMQLGSSWFGSSTVLTTLWCGAAPALAMILLHVASKQIVGTSPFTFKGMKSMATKGIDPSMALGLGTAAAGAKALWNRGRAKRAGGDHGEYGMRTGGTAVADRSGASKSGHGKHDGIGAMDTSDKANASKVDPTAGMEQVGTQQGKAALAAQKRKKKAAIGTDKDGKALTPWSVVRDAKAEGRRGEGHEGRGALQAGAAGVMSQLGQMRQAGKADRKILAAQRRADWAAGGGLLGSTGSVAYGAHRAGQIAKTAVRTPLSGAKRAGSWALHNKKKVAAMGVLGAAALPLGVAAAPVALAGGALALGTVAGGKAIASRGERIQQRRVLADQALANGGTQRILAQQAQRKEKKLEGIAQANADRKQRALDKAARTNREYVPPRQRKTELGGADTQVQQRIQQTQNQAKQKLVEEENAKTAEYLRTQEEAQHERELNAQATADALSQRGFGGAGQDTQASGSNESSGSSGGANASDGAGSQESPAPTTPEPAEENARKVTPVNPNPPRTVPSDTGSVKLGGKADDSGSADRKGDGGLNLGGNDHR